MRTFDSEHHSIDFSEHVLDGSKLNITSSMLDQAARRVAALNERTAEQAIIHAQAEEIERLRSQIKGLKSKLEIEREASNKYCEELEAIEIMARRAHRGEL